jgi:hypothetical protein
MATKVSERSGPASPAMVLAKAATRAAERLGIRQRELGEIIGVSPSSAPFARSTPLSAEMKPWQRLGCATTIPRWAANRWR